MATYHTDAEETRERIAPDIIIARGNCRQIRIHQFKGEKATIRPWIRGNGREWTPNGAGLRLHVWELQELVDLLPGIIENRLTHAASFAAKRKDSVNSPPTSYDSAVASAADPQ